MLSMEVVNCALLAECWRAIHGGVATIQQCSSANEFCRENSFFIYFFFFAAAAAADEAPLLDESTFHDVKGAKYHRNIVILIR